MEQRSTADARARTRAVPGGSISRRGALVAIPLAALSGCGVVGRLRPAPTVTLTIVSSGWTGWSEEQPEPEDSTEEVTEGTEFERPALGEAMTFTVLSVTSEELTLRTSSPMSTRSESGGIDLRTDEDTFTIAVGETLEIVTPTMDGGTTFEVTYEE